MNLSFYPFDIQECQVKIETCKYVERSQDHRKRFTWKALLQKLYFCKALHLRYFWESWLRVLLRRKCPYSELFWSVFSRIRTEYGELRSISPYSVPMQENTDQNNSEYGYFLCSVWYKWKFTIIINNSKIWIHYWNTLWYLFKLTPMFLWYRNQSIDTSCKSIDWFLYDLNIVLNWVIHWYPCPHKKYFYFNKSKTINWHPCPHKKYFYFNKTIKS